MPFPLKVKNSIFFKVYFLFSIVLVIVFLTVHLQIVKKLEGMTTYQFRVKNHSETELLALNVKKDFEAYNYKGIYLTADILLKSDPDLFSISLYEFSPSNKLIFLKRTLGKELPFCGKELLDYPCLHREVKRVSSEIPVFIEVLFSTERLVIKFKHLKTNLLITEFLSFVFLFFSFFWSYRTLRIRTFKIIDMLESWRKGLFTPKEPSGNDEFSFVEKRLIEVFNELEREKDIDESLLKITSWLLELLVRAKDESEFIEGVEKTLKDVLDIDIKVLKNVKEKIGCRFSVSLIKNKDITLCFSKKEIPDQLLSILINIIDTVFLAFKEKNEKERLFFQTILALANAIDATSPWTKGHSQKVAEIAGLIGKALGLKDEEVEKLWIAGVLHDIGKIGIDKEILDKPGKLSPDEYKKIKEHSKIGYEVLKPIKLLRDILPAVLYHHERYDGSGYPEGLKGSEIPLFARIIAVADVIEAMTAERPYKKSRSFEEVLEHLKENKGKLYDPEVVEAVLKASDKIKELLYRSNSIN